MKLYFNILSILQQPPPPACFLDCRKQTCSQEPEYSAMYLAPGRVCSLNQARINSASPKYHTQSNNREWLRQRPSTPAPFHAGEGIRPAAPRPHVSCVLWKTLLSDGRGCQAPVRALNKAQLGANQWWRAEVPPAKSNDFGNGIGKGHHRLQHRFHAGEGNSSLYELSLHTFLRLCKPFSSVCDFASPPLVWGDNETSARLLGLEIVSF